MDKERALLIIVCMLLCLCCTVAVTVTNTNRDREEEEDEKQNNTSFWLWQKLRTFYSLYSKVWSPASWQWNMLKEAYYLLVSPHVGFSKGGAEMKDATKSGNEKMLSSKLDSQHQNEL